MMMEKTFVILVVLGIAVIGFSGKKQYVFDEVGNFYHKIFKTDKL